ncbi:MAG: dipeptide epimerase [Opitutaceae bacterium]|nr:dipeptide epimerase [Cytophagales bacterium]
MALKWSIELKRLELKYTWAISRNASDFKINAFIKVTDGINTGIGEAAPNVRYNETPDLLALRFSELTFLEFKELKEFIIWLNNQELPNALRFGIESAYISYLANCKGESVCSILGLKEPVGRNTAYTIPIMPVEKLENYLKDYNLKRFRFIKIKVNSENLVPFVAETRRHLDNSLIIDANEAYTDPDSFLRDIELLDDPNLEFIEQPFPATSKEEYLYLKKVTRHLIFADESITNQADFELIKECFHGVNIKLMKAGGFLNGIQLLRDAKSHGLKTMVGCMVETGLGISGGYCLSSLADYLDLDSFLLLKNDPYPYINEKDGILSLSGKANEHEFL